MTTIGTAITRGLSGIGSFASGALRIGAFGIAAASAAQSVVGLVSALAPLGGFVAALPAAIGGAAVAIGTLKLATLGFGDALKNLGDPEKFAESIAKLSPSARQAAVAIQGLLPQLKSFQQAIQQSFFERFAASIAPAAKNLLTLRSNFQAVAAAAGLAVERALQFAQTEVASGQTAALVDGVAAAIRGASNAVQPLLQGFLDLGAVVSQTFGTRLGAAIGDLGVRVGNFLSSFAGSGAAVDLIENAITAAKQLGQVLGNIGGILSAVFSAANAAGGGFLGNLQVITANIETFVKSAQGSQALVNVFTALSSVAANLGPIIAALVTQLGALAPSIAPILNTIGPAIVTAINALGPAIQGILPGLQSLVSGLADGFEQIANSGALTAIGKAIGEIGTAIAPILPIAGQLIGTLGNALAPVLSALAPVLGAVVGAIGSLVNAISPLLTVAGQLIAQLGPILTPIINALAQAWQAAAPVVQTLANILSSVLGPILAILPSLIQPLLDGFTQMAALVLPQVNDLLTQLQPSLVQVSTALVQVLVALVPVITQMVTLAVKIATSLMPLLEPLIGLIGQLASIFAGSLAKVLTGVVVPALDAIAALLRGDFSGAFKSMKEVVSGVISAVKDQFVELPLKILSAVASFGSLLVSAGSDLIQGLINGIRNAAGSLVSAAKDVVGDAIAGAKNLLGINSPSKVFYVIGQQTGQGMINGLDSMAAKVGDASSRMAEAAVAPFADLAVSGPTVNNGTAVGGLTNPFAAAAADTVPTTRTTRQTTVQGATNASGGATIQNTFYITEAGNAETTAERVINRQVLAAAVL